MANRNRSSSHRLDTVDYTSVSTTVTVTVAQATPTVIIYPVYITQGTALINSQLTGASSVPGSATFTTDAGKVLNAGDGQSESVTFTPTDTVDYTTVSTTVIVNVAPGQTQATPTVAVNPVNISYGTPLANSQLGGTSSVPGSFSFTTDAGKILNAGNGRSEAVTFTPTDSTDYASVSTTVIVNVAQAQPTATANPVNITYGTALANSQLGGTSSVPGSFSFTTDAGKILNAGNGQTEFVTFTPTDMTDYTSATAQVLINVDAKALTASIIGTPTKLYDGSTSATLTPASFQLTGLVGSESFTVTQTAGTYNSADTNATSVSANLAANNFTAGAGTSISDYLLPTTASGAGAITGIAQTIAFNVASPLIYGDAPAALTATGGGSGNPVTFSVVSGPGSLAGGMLSITGVGVIVLEADQAGNLNYAAALAVQRTLVVVTTFTNSTVIENENATPTPITVSSLLGSHYAEPDGAAKANPGIAVFQTDSNGTWQYSINQTTWTAMGNVSQAQAILLPGSDSLRFVPAPNFSGQADLYFVGWDGSQGTAGNVANIVATGGTTPFSVHAGTLDITVNSVPIWVGAGAALMSLLPGTYRTSDQTTPAGNTIASVFGSYFQDNNPAVTVGVAIVSVTGVGNGIWQFLPSSGGAWANFPTVSTATALLLSANDMIRFVPKNNFAGTVSLTALAWDGSVGVDGKPKHTGQARLQAYLQHHDTDRHCLGQPRADARPRGNHRAISSTVRHQRCGDGRQPFDNGTSRIRRPRWQELAARHRHRWHVVDHRYLSVHASSRDLATVAERFGGRGDVVAEQCAAAVHRRQPDRAGDADLRRLGPDTGARRESLRHYERRQRDRLQRHLHHAVNHSDAVEQPCPDLGHAGVGRAGRRRVHAQLGYLCLRAFETGRICRPRREQDAARNRPHRGRCGQRRHRAVHARGRQLEAVAQRLVCVGADVAEHCRAALTCGQPTRHGDADV